MKQVIPCAHCPSLSQSPWHFWHWFDEEQPSGPPFTGPDSHTTLAPQPLQPFEPDPPPLPQIGHWVPQPLLAQMSEHLCAPPAGGVMQ